MNRQGRQVRQGRTTEEIKLDWVSFDKLVTTRDLIDGDLEAKARNTRQTLSGLGVLGVLGG
jgi:hypothetical protein